MKKENKKSQNTKKSGNTKMKVKEKQVNKKQVINKNSNEIQDTISEKINKVFLVNGIQTILLVAIIFAIYIGVNIFLEKQVLPEIDLTKDKVNSLSEFSIDKMKEIDKDVKLTLINYGDEDNITLLVEKYIAQNNKISVERINDVASRPDITQKYQIEVAEPLILINCGDIEMEVRYYDLMTYDDMTMQQIDKSEEALTNAIVNATVTDKTKIYYMTNHTLYSEQYFTTAFDGLRKEANEVESLDLLIKGSVPEDADVLMMTTLKEDITPNEKDSIISFIQRGGDLIILDGLTDNVVSKPNYQAVLDEYGVTVERGMIFEQDASKQLSGYPNLIVEEISGTSMAYDLKMQAKALFVNSGKIVMKDDETLNNLNVTHEAIAKTSEKAFLRTDLSVQTQGRTDLDGTEEAMTICSAIEKQIDTENGIKSQLLIFANDMFAMDIQMNLGAYPTPCIYFYNNQDLILNSAAYLSDKPNSITIRKSYDDVKYTPTEAQHNIIMVIIFALPVIIMLSGLIVWIVRRKKGNRKINKINKVKDK